MQKIIGAIVLALLAVGCSTHPPSENIASIVQKAEAGDVDAQAEIGYLYQYGDGVEKDSSEAFKWNLKAANQGSPMAQHNLAVMYDEGVDIPEDNLEAIKWYRKAAEQGNPRAQLNLGVMYWRGEGVPKDLERAWNLLNTVRVTSYDKEAEWAARGALDEIKKEIGADTGPFGYPEWGALQKTVK